MGVLHRIVACCACALSVVAGASAQNIKAVAVGTGLDFPTTVAVPPGDFQRIFVNEQHTGRIRIIENGVLLPTPFLDLSAKLGATPGNQGLLGLAFHPQFATNGFFYVDYTNPTARGVIERYHVSTSNPNVADPSSAKVILGPITQTFNAHWGGCLQFGPDGKLYISKGDGGTSTNGQSGNTLNGKLMRLDVNAPPPYIPADNPFVTNPNVKDEIWHTGLRNPWRFSFDRLTGDLYIGDVGANDREEINFAPAGVGGLNFGWSCLEGTLCTGTAGCNCAAPALRAPIAEYDHSFGQAVIGGYMYRGCAIPSLVGHYVYADVSSRVWSFTFDGVNKGPTIEHTSQLGFGAGNMITSFGEDAYGELLMSNYATGEIYKIVPDPMIDCNANGTADACDIASGHSVDGNGNGIPDECECPQPSTYCTAKLNSLGCFPSIKSTGIPSATLGSGFFVRCKNVINNKPGLLLYSTTGPASNPFQNGTLCVKSPIRRSLIFQSHGNPFPAHDCSGVLAFDFNAFAAGTLGGQPIAALKVPGTAVNCQWWGPDTGFPAPANTMLSDGLAFVMCP